LDAAIRSELSNILSVEARLSFGSSVKQFLPRAHLFLIEASICWILGYLLLRALLLHWLLLNRQIHFKGDLFRFKLKTAVFLLKGSLTIWEIAAPTEKKEKNIESNTKYNYKLMTKSTFSQVILVWHHWGGLSIVQLNSYMVHSPLDPSNGY